MSQLDVSISFSHLISLLIIFYIFLYYMVYILLYYWYNIKFRFIEIKNIEISERESINNLFLKKILKV